MSLSYAEILRRHAQPVEPIPTDLSPQLKPLEGIRAVLFDLYGTLFISGSGEVGTIREAACEAALADAFDALGIASPGAAETGMKCYLETIETLHVQGRAAGITYPEVDVIEVWRTVLAELARRRLVDEALGQSVDLARLAVEYEARANPVWPMPGLQTSLRALLEARLALGLVSNAQFYTRELFPAFLGETLAASGFAPDLCFFSYEHGWGKPGPRLFELASRALGLRGIAPHECLYVGNDMLNDVFAAAASGFRTALFAGDARSLRLRLDDPRVQKMAADLVLTRLNQVVDCIIT